ncbi:MAG: preprotein translocase subunit YajC [Phycisphaerales bacterium]|nr:MAG: preprotein translocase subunit YajC [Phycisphaerales bacterium]
MSYYRILAASEANTTGSSVKSTPITNEQTETTTKVQSDPNTAGQQYPKDRGGGGGGYMQLIWIVMIFGVMYLILFRGPRKRQQQHRQMVQSLQKNDKVRTIGGIIGTVVDIKGDEITLKVDESNNTKIRLVSSAIGKNMSKDND